MLHGRSPLPLLFYALHSCICFTGVHGGHCQANEAIALTNANDGQESFASATTATDKDALFLQH